MSTQIKNYDFKEGLPFGFEILDLKQLFKSSKTLLNHPHRTGFYEIVWFKNAETKLWVDFVDVEVKENTLMFFNKHVVKQLVGNSKQEGLVFLFNDDFFCKSNLDMTYLNSHVLLNNLLNNDIQIELNEESLLFEVIFSQLQTEFNKKQDEYQARLLRNGLNNLLLHAERMYQHQGNHVVENDVEVDIFIRFKELLENNFSTQKQVQFYADTLYITSKKLNQITQKVLGKTPKVIIHDRILLEAKRELVHSQKNIQEIAYYLGFSESTNFVKYFKKYTKMTPNQFKEEHLWD